MTLPSELPPPDPRVAAPPPPPAMDWQRLHVATPLLNALKDAVRFWPVALIALVDGGSALTVVVFGAGIALLLGLALIRYLRFDYRLEGTTLTVRAGVFVRRTRTIPADRVQQVTSNQRLRHRMLDVAEVAIEVAGAGSEPDVSLAVVSRAEAERIRGRLQDARRARGSAPPALDEIVYSQPNASLIKWAAISSPLFMLAPIAALVGTIGETVDLERAWGWLPDGSEVGFLALVAVAGLVAATAFNVIRFYDLRLVKADRNLRLEYGLLTHRRLELPTDRVQALVTRLSPAGRLSGTVGMTAHNASSAGGATNSYLPAVPRLERRRLLALLIPGVNVAAPISGHPRAALRRSILRWIRPVVAIAAIGSLALRSPWALTLWIGLLPALVLGVRAWRVLGHGENADVILSRRGAINDSLAAVRKGRVQSASTQANWFQRRSGLATLRIEVAQPLGKVVIRDMNASEAGELAQRLAAGGRNSQGEEHEDHEDDQENEALEAADLPAGEHRHGGQHHG